MLRLSLEPDVAVGLLELCSSCAGTLARLLNGVELRRAGAGVIAQALAPTSLRGRRGRPGPAFVLRAISYLAIAAVVFFAVTMLTSLR